MPLERSRMPQGRRNTQTKAMTQPGARSFNRRPARPAPNLPSKGWCFHRGAKLSIVDALGQKNSAVWYCSHCQNYSALALDV